MIGKLIEWSLRNRFLVVCFTLLIIAIGVFELRRTPVDAIPDLSENQVIVFADWPGRSPQEVEDPCSKRSRHRDTRSSPRNRPGTSSPI